MANLRVKDADLIGRVLFLRNHPTHRLKDRADRRVKMNDVAIEVLSRRRLAAEPDPETLLFPSKRGTVLNLYSLRIFRTEDLTLWTRQPIRLARRPTVE